MKQKNKTQGGNLPPLKAGRQAGGDQRAGTKVATISTKRIDAQEGIIDKMMGLFYKRKKRYSVQDTIPYQKMYENGICLNNEGYYNKMIAFSDTNYKLATEEGCDRVFIGFSKLINHFSGQVSVQFCYANSIGRMEEEESAIAMKGAAGVSDEIVREYQQMLSSQLLKGKSGQKKNRYLVFGVKAGKLQDAAASLDRIELDILNHFKKISVKAESLNGYERLKILHNMLHPDARQKFMFDWKECAIMDKNSKDYIVPDRFFFPKDNGKYMMIDDWAAAVSGMEIIASELPDDLLTSLLDTDTNMNVSIHVRPIDQVSALKMARNKRSEVEKNIVDVQKKAVRAGYNPDFVPPELEEYRENLKDLIKKLQKRDEKLFYVTFSMMNIERHKKILEERIAGLAGICSQNNCVLHRLYNQQEQGLWSALPLGVRGIDIDRILTTSATASFIPFSTEELFMPDAESLYYGINPLSHNMILANRKKLATPNGLILGTPGSGKSFFAKREIVNTFIVTEDDIIISDPESEYGNLTRYLGGEVIKISSTSSHYLNPLDLNSRYGDDDTPLKQKSTFILSLLELVQGGLTATEKSVIDRCLPKIYGRYFESPVPENLPILQDLYEELQNQGEAGQHLAEALEIYVTGTLNVFNHHTNVDMSKRLICFDIKDLGKQLSKIGMLIVNDQVWNKVTANREDGTNTWYYEDEFHLKFKDPLTAQHSAEMWKRFRKWGAIPTGITQNVKEMLSSTEVETIFENTDFLIMLNQGPEGKKYLSQALALSEQQEAYITNTEEGEGLLFYRPLILPFFDRFPKQTKLYQMMTTKFSEMQDERKE